MGRWVREVAESRLVWSVMMEHGGVTSLPNKNWVVSDSAVFIGEILYPEV